MSKETSNGKRLAKNTLLLYVRTIFVMVVSLFTSRVILEALGIDDYGTYNVIGGVVVMFSVITGALSNAISRFITFELGKGDKDKLVRIFSTSINIQLFFSVIIILLGETIGLWFLNSKMNIPIERMYAANWVYQCSLITFVINLLSVPYNAAIIAHEKMSAFAYVSILEVSLKLLIVYMLFISPWDKLITYSVLLVIVSVVIRFSYSLYCNRHFEETKYHIVHDRVVVKEMTGFASWNILSNAAYLFNTQGVNILINLFFGVGVNAARGVATQVESAIMKFVTDFTTAINPQITKSYAQGELQSVYRLVCTGAKITFYLLFLLSLPVLIETDYILQIWLKNVPEHTAAFIRLSILGTMIDRLLFTGYTACMATGNIKRYVKWITSIGCLVFPIAYVVFKLGAPAESVYIVFACVYICVDMARLYIMKGLLQFPVAKFVKEVVFKVILVSGVSVALPLILLTFMPSGLERFIVSTIVCLVVTSISIYAIGLSKSERIKIKEMVSNLYKKIKK